LLKTISVDKPQRKPASARLVHSFTKEDKNHDRRASLGKSRMKISRTLVTISLALIVAVAFAAAIQKQKSASLSGFTLSGKTEMSVVNGIQFNIPPYLTPASPSSPFFFPPSNQCIDIAETPASPLWNSTRTEIYDFIAANPGVQFRGICNDLGLSVGLAQFHLGVLTKAGLVSFFRDGKYKRFFESKRFSRKQMKIISLFRHETTGNILRTLLERRKVSHGELAHELSITSQGLTWQISRLKKDQLIVESKENKKQLYSIQCTSAPLLSEMAKLLQPT
jgi:DNA-binding transcriptional ArsR family regulator